ncbi:MAG: hypothetical protein MJ228_04950 [Bacilli bacterium]|nr:hypothetical protein [Bacilli bacterium]
MKVSKILLAAGMAAGLMLASCGGTTENSKPSASKSASAPKSSGPKDSTTTTYTLNVAGAKTSYKIWEGTDLTGVVCKKIETHTINTSKNAETDVSAQVKGAWNADKTKIVVTAPDGKTTAEINVTLDTAAANNTITGQVKIADTDTDVTIVLNSRTQATATAGTKTCVFAITQGESGAILGAKKGAKTSGDDDLYNALAENLTFSKTAAGALELAKASFWIQAEGDREWNNSLDADAWVTVALSGDMTKAVVMFTWSYEETQHQKDSYLITCTVTEAETAGNLVITLDDILAKEGAVPGTDEYNLYAKEDRIGGELNDPYDQLHWHKSNGGASHEITAPTAEKPAETYSPLLAYL